MRKFINRRPKLFKAISLIAVLLLLVASGFWLISWLTKPINVSSNSLISVIVPKGESVIGIGEQLHDQDLIRHPLLFRLVVKQLGLGEKIQAGTFQLSQNMSVYQIARAMTEGTQDTWVTLLEGWRREEMAEYLAAQEFVYFDQDEFLELTENLEGRLYPDTYLLPKEVTTSAVVNLLSSTFDQKVTNQIGDEIEAFAKQKGIAYEDVITMASLIEREARDYEQMRHVSGILWNRIDIDMALQVDASLQYVIAPVIKNGEKVWWPVIDSINTQSNSRYNTYQYQGLPPGPIANPSLQAIRAAINPLDVGDFYYLHSPDGNMYYSATYEGHLENINKYLR